MKQVLYSKKLICNDQSNKALHYALDHLKFFVFENIEKNGEQLDYFKIRLKDSDDCVNAKEIQFDWAVLAKDDT
jgi:hypothetical protein